MMKSSAVAPRIKSSPAPNRGRATKGQTRADAALGSLIKDVLASGPSGKKVLVIDVGGTSVKILASGQTEIRSFRSGPTLTPGRMVSGVKKLAADWMYEVVSIGYPGPVLGGRPTADPPNLGRGWIGFDFATAFGRPVKVVNDAAMQDGKLQGRQNAIFGPWDGTRYLPHRRRKGGAYGARPSTVQERHL